MSFDNPFATPSISRGRSSANNSVEFGALGGLRQFAARPPQHEWRFRASRLAALFPNPDQEKPWMGCWLDPAVAWTANSHEWLLYDFSVRIIQGMSPLFCLGDFHSFRNCTLFKLPKGGTISL